MVLCKLALEERCWLSLLPAHLGSPCRLHLSSLSQLIITVSLDTLIPCL